MKFEIIEHYIEGYEKVLEAKEAESGLHAIIAIHSSKLGPAIGGTRFYPFKSFEEALKDVLRLSKGMTYKAAHAMTGSGGGKSVIIGDPKTDKTEAILEAFAHFVNTLEGTYYCAEDIGFGLDDVAYIQKHTNYVVLVPEGAGDPSPFTAWGVYRGIQASAQKLWSSTSLKGKTIAIQGVGNVGRHLIEHLFWDEAKLIISDISQDSIKNAQKLYGDAVSIVPIDKIHSVKCDIFAPCAIGGILNEKTINELNCAIVAGGANNQLFTEDDGMRLYQKGILYAPDYVINSGGLIAACTEFFLDIFNPKILRDQVNHIYKRTLDLFNFSEKNGIATSKAADIIAEKNLQKSKDKVLVS